MMTNVMVKTCLNQKIIKNSNLIQAMKNSVCPKAKVIRRPNFSESRICPNIYRMLGSFRSVDWTHEMIIVKWHLFIWHERKLCALTSAPPVQSTQTGQWLSTLFHANCSAAHVYVFYPRQFIFALSCRRRSFLQVLQSTECALRRIFWKIFCVSDDDKCYGEKTCLRQKIIKNRNLIQAMKNSVYPKALKRKLSESRIFSKAEFVRIFVRIFTECSEVWIEDVDWRHDMIIVNWGEVTLIQFFRKPNLFEYLPNVP